MNERLRECNDITISGGPITDPYDGQTTEASATHLRVIMGLTIIIDNGLSTSVHHDTTKFLVSLIYRYFHTFSWLHTPFFLFHL